MTPVTPGNGSPPGEQFFVSYARVQSPLVEGLVEALEAVGLSTWTDVKGLYGGEAFWPEIVKAIDAAPAVIVVISSDSVASPHCLREFEHAVAMGKRIVPVCVREPASSAVPSGVSQIQWIFCRQLADTTRAAKDIAAAVAADWSWLRLGARILSRAGEWRDAGRERSRLLRGTELREAVTWSVRVPSDGSRPAELHLEFLGASRANARQRLRRLSFITVSVAAVLVVVGTMAWLRYVESVNRLNVGALEKESVDTNLTALSDARRALAMCEWVLLRTATCNHAEEILGVALQVNNRFDESIEVLSRSIAPLETAGEDDRERRLMLGDLLWHRSLSRIYRAESRGDDGVRSAGYVDAKVDFERARTIFARWRKDALDRPLETTAARFALNAGHYAEAAAALDRELRPSAETDMLRSLVLLCGGRPNESMQWLQTFIGGLGGSTEHPLYQRNQAFLSRVRRQCVNQLTH